MKTLTRLIVGIVLVHAGCGDDDNDNDDDVIRIDAAVNPIDAPIPTDLAATLTTAMEVPVCAAAGAAATGATTVTIPGGGSSVRVETLTFSGLSGPATMAHIHFGPPGVAGPVIFPFGADLTPPVGVMTFTAADYPSPPPAGAPATYAEFIREMRAGNSYINVHTAACPPGEIRGQLQ